MTDEIDNDYETARRLFDQKDPAAAKRLLASVFERAPDHLEALRLAARIAALEQDWQCAHDRLTRALAIAPNSPTLYYQYAVTCDKLMRPDEAEAHLRRVLEIDPDFADAHRRLADLLLVREDPAEAERHYRCVLALRPDQYESLALLHQAMQKQGRSDDFIAYCRQLIARVPDHAGTYLQLGVAQQKRGDVDGALQSYRQVIARDPACYEAYWYVGALYRSQGNMEAAIEWLQKAVALRPHAVEAKALLCDAYEMVDRLDDAERLAREVVAPKAGATQSTRVLATTVLASVLRRRKRPAEGYAALSGIEIPSDPNEAQGALFELGRLADDLGDYPAAFEHFRRGNAALKLAQRASDEDKAAYHRRIERVRSTFTPEWVATWPRYPADALPVTPVFIVGFPRSGTTLIDRVLDCHPDIQVMEERPVMSPIQREIERMTGNDLSALPRLTTTQWRQLRGRYLAIADEYTKPGQGTMIVDKMPLNLLWAGICHWLFPEARFIFSIRHPCDVVLSCFMQPFVFNQANANYYTVEDGALLYDRAMALWQHYRTILPIPCHSYRYEDLIDDFETTVRGVLDFLDQPWHPELAHFDRKARERGHVRIPSYWQVSQPIYRSAHFRWQRYRDQIAGVLPLLEPWAKRFGYEA